MGSWLLTPLEALPTGQAGARAWLACSLPLTGLTFGTLIDYNIQAGFIKDMNPCEAIMAVGREF